jgi:glycosyltransferase involved in cell wall biosynthesis
LVLDKPVCTSFIQRLPFAKTKFRSYLPLFPLAAEALDVSGYDVVISNSHAVAKGVLTGPEQIHISYCHTPMRYAWDLREQYLQERNLDRGFKQWPARYLLQQLRLWDIASSRNVDYFVANSNYIAGRIRKFYGRESTVIYPPVYIQDHEAQISKEDFYLTVSRMVPYKRIPLIAEAFRNLPGRQLVIIGDGPEMSKVQKAAAGAGNIKVLGYQPDDVMRDYMKRARAFIFAAKEDFGIVPVEAQAFGTPVIAYGEGGAQETVRGLGEDDAPTGIFFDEQSVASLVAAIQRFENNRDCFSAEYCRNNALRFAPERFSKEFETFFESCLAKSRRGRNVAPKPRRLALAQNE